MNSVFFLLGSNIEPRYKYLEEAEKKLVKVVGALSQRSGIYESEPLGFTAKQVFLNRVLLICSKLSTTDILKQIHNIETELGRERSNIGYTSRTIDIDILYYNNEVMNTDILTIPHPRMHERMFTLVPLAEIAPDFIHPTLNINTNELIELCPDNSKISVFKIQEDK